MHVLLDVAAKTFGGEMLMRVAVACTIVFANKNDTLCLNKDREQVPWP